MERVRTLAHLSDLHFGTRAAERGAEALVRSVLHAEIDHVVVTGDVTERGLWREYDGFERTFAPLLREGRVTVIPGNHDRPGDDVGATMMDGQRVVSWSREGLHVIAVDSTGSHNRFVLAAHGRLTEDDLRELDAALSDAPRDRLVVVAMHHHPLPLPEETGLEHLSRMCGLPFAAELEQVEQMLALCRGRCDLVLHGHRHVPVVLVSRDAAGVSVPVINAGSSTELLRMRVFTHARGRVLGRHWLEARPFAEERSAWGSALQDGPERAQGIV